MNLLAQKYDQVKLYIVISIVAFLPYQMHISNTLIGVGAALTILKMIYLRTWNLRQVNTLALSFIGYFILEAIGLLHTAPENLLIGLRVLDQHQSFIFVPLIFSDFELDIKKRQLVFLTFIISCFVGVIVCVSVNMYVGLELYDQFFHEWLFTHDRFADPIGLTAVYLSLYISFAIFILLNFYFERLTLFPDIKKDFLSLEKDLIVFFLLIFFGALVTLGSRTVIVSFVLIAITYLLAYATSRKIYKPLIIAALIPLILIALVFINPVVKLRFMDLGQKQYEHSNYGSYFARLHIWRPGIDAIKENIWLGVGTGDHHEEMNKKYLKYNYTEGIRLAFNMHNQFLHTTLNHGIPGLLILLVIFAVQVKHAFRNNDWLYLAFLSLFVLACFTESTLVRNKGVIFLVFFSFVFFKSKK